MKKSVLILLLITSIYGFSQEYLNLKKGVIAKGYDVTAYFNNKAVKGQEKYSYTYKGAKYWFQNQNNKELFKKSPEKFVPQYGGYCAYAIGKNGKKVDIDPETFTIIEGKLYLFYNSFMINTLNSWNKNNPKQLKIQADKNWQKIKM